MHSVLTSQRRLVLAVAAVFALLTSVLALAALDQADAQPAVSCSGQVVRTLGNTDFGVDGKVFSNTLGPGRVTSRSFSVNVPAGTYDVNAMSYDGYNDRPTTPTQTNESWVADFVSGGTVLATSSPTADLADGIIEASWSGNVGSIVLASPVDTIVVRHAFLTNKSPNSVKPICLGFVNTTPPPQTTVPATTTPATTTPATTTPATTEPPSTDTTAAPPTTELPVCDETTVGGAVDPVTGEPCNPGCSEDSGPDAVDPVTGEPCDTSDGNPCDGPDVIPGVTIDPATGNFCVEVLGTTQLPPVTNPPVVTAPPATAAPSTCEPPLVAAADGTCVGGAVQIAPVAQPVGGNPNFTG